MSVRKVLIFKIHYHRMFEKNLTFFIVYLSDVYNCFILYNLISYIFQVFFTHKLLI